MVEVEPLRNLSVTLRNPAVCIILLFDFGRKLSNVSFYRFNFETFYVSFFSVSFYWSIILLVQF